MEITIVEPCPECGQLPRKITAELDGFDQWMSFRCSCGFSQSYKVSDFYEGLRKWNEEAIHIRFEKKAKSCPFCGNKELKIVIERRDLSWAVTCQKCGARSGLRGTKQCALEIWNRRPDSDE